MKLDLVDIFSTYNLFLLFTSFADDGWTNRWVKSKSKEAEGTAGTWEISAGKYYNDANEDKGLKTAQDARFYQISSALPKEFSNKGKDLIFQFSVKHEQKIDCGGGYFKLLPAVSNFYFIFVIFFLKFH